MIDRYPHLGRPAGRKNRSGAGYSYLHTAVDDHSRLAYSEILTDEKKETAAGFGTRAQAFFASCGITVQQVLTDNGACYSPTCGATPGRRGNRPQAHQGLPATDQRQGRTPEPHPAGGMGLRRPYRSETERRAAFTEWLHTYNHHRGHTALKGRPPASRVPNLTGQYN